MRRFRSTERRWRLPHRASGRLKEMRPSFRRRSATVRRFALSELGVSFSSYALMFRFLLRTSDLSSFSSSFEFNGIGSSGDIWELNGCYRYVIFASHRDCHFTRQSSVLCHIDIFSKTSDVRPRFYWKYPFIWFELDFAVNFQFHQIDCLNISFSGGCFVTIESLVVLRTRFIAPLPSRL